MVRYFGSVTSFPEPCSIFTSDTKNIANREGICTNFSSVGISKTVLRQSHGSEYRENPFFFLSAVTKKAILATYVDNEEREGVAF